MADISLVFDVAGGGTLKGESGGIISGQLQSIVNEINKTPYHIKFDADPASLNSIKDAITHALDGVGPGKDISNNISKSISSGVKDIIGSIQDLGTKGVAQVEKITGSLQDLLTVVNQLNSKEFGFSATFNNNDKTEKRISELELYQREALETVSAITKLIQAYGSLSSATRTAAKNQVIGSNNQDFNQTMFAWDNEYYEKESRSKSLSSVQFALDKLRSIYDQISSVMRRANEIDPTARVIDTSAVDRARQAIEAFKDEISQTKQTIDGAAQTATNPLAKLLEGLQVGVGGLKTEGVEKSVGGISDQLDTLRKKIESTFDLSTIDFHEGVLVEKIEQVSNTLHPITEQLNALRNAMAAAQQKSAEIAGNTAVPGSTPVGTNTGKINMPFILNDEEYTNLTSALSAIEGLDDSAIQKIAAQFLGVEATVTKIKTSIANAADEEKRFYDIAVSAENAANHQRVSYSIRYDPNEGTAERSKYDIETNYKAREEAARKAYDAEMDAMFKAHEAEIRDNARVEAEIAQSYNRRAMAAEEAAEKERQALAKENTIDVREQEREEIRKMNAAYNALEETMRRVLKTRKAVIEYNGSDAGYKATLTGQETKALTDYKNAYKAAEGYRELAEEQGRAAKTQKVLNDLSDQYDVISSKSAASAREAAQKKYNAEMQAMFEAHEAELRDQERVTAEIERVYNEQAMAAEKAAERERQAVDRENAIDIKQQETEQIREMTEAYKNLDDTMSKYYKALSAQSSYTGDDKRVAEALQANVDATKQAYEEAQRATEKYDGQAFAADRAAESTKRLEAAQRGLNLATAQGQERVDHKAEAEQIREMTEAYNQLDKAAKDWYAAQGRLKQYTGDDADYKKLLADQEASARADYETAKRAAEQYGKLAEEKGRAAKSQELLNDLEENYARISHKAESSAETAEKKANNERAKAADLMQRIVAAENNWTAAKNGRSSEDYKNLTSLRLNLSSLINEYNTGSKDVNEFSKEVSSLNAQFQASSVNIKAVGEDTSSLMKRFQSIGAQFGAWIGASRIVMSMIRSLKQLVSASIEVDTAMTQLRIVTNASNAELEEYGDTFARTAKQIGASITDLIDSATVFGRLGYSLSESSSLAKFTAMLKAVGNIEISDAQDAVTAITKAFSDEVRISDIESVMDRLVEVGKGLPRHTVTYVYVIGYNGQRRTGIISETVERFSITNTIYPERLSCCN